MSWMIPKTELLLSGVWRFLDLQQDWGRWNRGLLTPCPVLFYLAASSAGERRGANSRRTEEEPADHWSPVSSLPWDCFYQLKIPNPFPGMAGVTGGAENRFSVSSSPRFLHLHPGWLTHPGRSSLEVKFQAWTGWEESGGGGASISRRAHHHLWLPSSALRLPPFPTHSASQEHQVPFPLHTVSFVSPLAGASATALVKELVSIFSRQSQKFQEVTGSLSLQRVMKGNGQSQVPERTVST